MSFALNLGSIWPFSLEFAHTARPLVFAFAGAYTFNVGNIVRRLYLSDLTEHVFWSAINRVFLTVGIAIVLATSGLSSLILFFAIGFIPNVFLK